MMKKHLISIVRLLSVLALLISCTTTPELREYKPKPAQEKGVISVPLLVGTEWLATKGSSQKLRLIDYGRKVVDYQAGHIPGAVFVDRKTVWDKVDGTPGMLPSVETMVQALENAGISSDSMVVIYDNSGGLWASRLFWALEYLGHRDVHILNGGWNKWVLEKRAVQVATSLPPRGKFIPRIQSGLLATKAWILENLSNPDVLIIDTRSPKEYAGEDVRAARGGHIPGAVNINWISNLKSDDLKTFAPEKKLAEIYDSRKISKNKIVVTHCQTGVRGTHTYFVLKLLGYPKARVYDGSWAEWGNDGEAPIVIETIDSPK
jgi:thiosulfate/3-mercaptopyruvate sulfurtransferase